MVEETGTWGKPLKSYKHVSPAPAAFYPGSNERQRADTLKLTSASRLYNRDSPLIDTGYAMKPIWSDLVLFV